MNFRNLQTIQEIHIHTYSPYKIRVFPINNKNNTKLIRLGFLVKRVNLLN